MNSYLVSLALAFLNPVTTVQSPQTPLAATAAKASSDATRPVTANTYLYQCTFVAENARGNVVATAQYQLSAGSDQEWLQNQGLSILAWSQALDRQGIRHNRTYCINVSKTPQ